MNQGLVTNDRFDPARRVRKRHFARFRRPQRSAGGGLASYPAQAVVIGSTRGALVASARLSRAIKNPGSSRGSRSCSSAYGILRARSSPWSRRPRPGVMLPPSCHGRNGEDSFAEAILSKGSRACSTQRQTLPWIWHGWRPSRTQINSGAAMYDRSGKPLRCWRTARYRMLEGGIARLPRSPGNFLVLRAGRPVLIIESRGKRLTGLSWASQADIDSALNLLLALTGPDQRMLKVETYNGISVYGQQGGRAS